MRKEADIEAIQEVHIEMKKILWATLLVLLTFMLACAAEESGVVYEAEDAVLHGKVAGTADAKASGGKAVGRFESDADTIDFIITVPADGVYDLTFVCKGIGGGKTNKVKVDGQPQGEFTCAGTSYEACRLRGVIMDAGSHTVTVYKSWGWIWLDSLTVTPAEAIPDSVFEVEARLVNPNATKEAQQLFAYLCDCYGKYTLAGQHSSYGTIGAECYAIHNVTGKYPAIIGMDMMDYSPARVQHGTKGYSIDQAIKFHKQGGIVTFCWHWNAPNNTLKAGMDNGNPRWWGGFYTRNTDFDIAAVMNGTDPEGKAAIDRDIKAIAEQMLRLQDEGVPVLWRPLHEASGGWFWWGAKGADACKQLWIYLYDQMTNVYGCNNLIWVWNGQAASWYPGDEYVDIVGQDIYEDKHVYSPNNALFTEIVEYTGGRKLIALTENGVVPDIDLMVKTKARWLWFNTWSGDFVQQKNKYSEAYTEAALLKKVYDSELVITLDELPAIYE